MENELFRLPVTDEEPLGNLSRPNNVEPETGMLTGFDTPVKEIYKKYRIFLGFVISIKQT